jgi:hypothetical protein
MVDMMVGASMAALFARLVVSARSGGARLALWEWGLATLGFMCLALVARGVAGLLDEGSPRAAAVVAAVFGVPTAVWVGAVFLLVRRRRTVRPEGPVDKAWGHTGAGGTGTSAGAGRGGQP